jgi:protease IV
MMPLRIVVHVLLVLGLALPIGCMPINIQVFPDYRDPLKEVTIQGEGRNKILLVHISGIISAEERREAFAVRPSMVQEVVAQLDMAAGDERVRAVVLLINTPGGSSTASDILYNEIARFKGRSEARVVASLMALATSGGYYAALAADRILAHPTSVTGSVGTVYLQPRVVGLMDKVGVEVVAFKSGEMKDMGAFFRNATEEEEAIFRSMIDQINSRFLGLVQERRELSPAKMRIVETARLFSAGQALDAGLIDSIGYVHDAIGQAAELAGIAEDYRVTAYRRTPTANDNVYNPSTAMAATGFAGKSVSEMLSLPAAGFYHLWSPEF